MGIADDLVCKSCGCSRSTVARTVARAKRMGIVWEKISTLSPEKVDDMLYANPSDSLTFKMPDYEYIAKEMTKPGVNLQILWDEYYESCKASNERPYQLTQFRKYYRDFISKAKVTMHLEHKRGEIMEVDWAGKTFQIKSDSDNTTIKAYLFVAVLPYSGYTYAEAFLSMDLVSWITAHVNAYAFFGGVTRILVPDNLKTGVVKNTKEETIINPTYLEMGEYYRTAIIPARPRSPKDKASVEGTVGNLTSALIGRLRNQEYFSLYELNQDISKNLEKFNRKPFQKKDGSRKSLYEDEKFYLQHLPREPYEIAVWKSLTVQYNYHVAIEGMNYSCPFELAHKKVDVRVSSTTVEIYYQGARVASHRRLLNGEGRYQTDFEHMPPEHQQYSRWNGDKFRKWAKTIGESTMGVVSFFLTSPMVEQQGYKSCMALLKLTDRYRKADVELACSKVLTMTHHPSLTLVKSVLATLKEIEKPDDIPKPSYGIVRGPEYYSIKEEKNANRTNNSETN